MTDICSEIWILIITFISIFVMSGGFLFYLSMLKSGEGQGLGEKNYKVIAAIIFVNSLLCASVITDFENDAIIALWGGFLAYLFTFKFNYAIY